MTAVDSTPANINFLSPLNFKFKIKKTPTLNFFVQKIAVPRMELPSPEQPNHFTRIPKPGDHLSFSDLLVTFKVDEDLKNYMEIYTWLVQMARSQNYEQYQAIDRVQPMSGEGIYSDLELTILSSKRQANYAVVFEDAFPIDLGEMEFDTTATDVNYVTAQATFRYKLYTITNI